MFFFFLSFLVFRSAFLHFFFSTFVFNPLHLRPLRPLRPFRLFPFPLRVFRFFVEFVSRRFSFPGHESCRLLEQFWNEHSLEISCIRSKVAFVSSVIATAYCIILSTYSKRSEDWSSCTLLEHAVPHILLWMLFRFIVSMKSYSLHSALSISRALILTMPLRRRCLCVATVSKMAGNSFK